MKTIKNKVISVLVLLSLAIGTTNAAASTDNEPPEVLNTTLSSNTVAYQGNAVPGYVKISLQTNEPTRGYLLAVRDDGVQARINLSTYEFKTQHTVNWAPWDDAKRAPLAPGTYRLKSYLNDAASNSAQGFPVGQLIVVSETNPKALVTVQSISNTTISPKYAVNDALTKITYELSRPAEVQVAIQKDNVTVYESSKVKHEAGIQSFEWNGKNSKGALIADGEYDVVFKTIETAYFYPSTTQTVQKLGKITITGGETNIPQSRLQEIVTAGSFEAETLVSGNSVNATITTNEPANVRVYIATEAGTHMNVVYAPSTTLQPGTHSFTWNGTDMMGSKALNGKYFIKVSVADSNGSHGYITVGNPVTVTESRTILPIQPEQQVRVIVDKANLKAYPMDQGAVAYKGDVLSLVAAEPTDGFYSVLVKGVPAKVNVTDVEMVTVEAAPSVPVETAPPTVPVESPATTSYTVVSGDTLWKIATKHATTIDTLVKLNNFDVTKALNIGQVLQVPMLETKQPEVGKTIHVVQSGDTLWEISQKYGITVSEILTANKLTTADYLYIGQELFIPIKATVPDANQTTYTVVSGDTLWKIAQKYGVTISEIQNANNISATSFLYIGQKLVIPTKVEQTSKTYTVVSGDTLWKIAVANQVTVQQLVDWNQLDITKPIFIGQQLKPELFIHPS